MTQTEIIKKEARNTGCLDCKMSKALPLDDEAQRLEKWLKEEKHGEMSYMENHFDKRINPHRLVNGVKSIITLTYNYYTTKSQRPDTYKISKYAYGKDYHKIIRKKVKKLVKTLEEKIGSFHHRIFVDSAPVAEKAWALRSGIGWMGKNTNIIHPKKGSFFFLAEIFCDLELEYDHEIPDMCGTCTRCIDSCPTEALNTPYSLDATKCLSYLTIELRKEIPKMFEGKTEDWIFGCDICQDVCPWNRFSEEHKEPSFYPNNGQWLDYDKNQWRHLSEDDYETFFRGSALGRIKYHGLKRNIEFVSK